MTRDSERIGVVLGRIGGVNDVNDVVIENDRCRALARKLDTPRARLPITQRGVGA